VTTNGGQTWTERNLGSNGSNGLSSGWYGFNANAAWATDQILYVCSETTTAGASHVTRSADGGATWTRADSGLPDVPVTKLAVDLGDGTGNTVYAATWLGVYRTTNGGTSWTLFGTGLPQGRVSDIYVAPDSSFIRVSTWGRGVWEMANVPVAGTVNITPASALLYVGDSGTFTGTVNGGGTVTYSTTVTGGTINASGLLNTTGATPGSYTVTATNAAVPAQVAVANVVVATPTPVTFPTQPSNVTAAIGQTATFTVVATGTGPLTYQWKKNGSAIGGATAATYTTPTLALIDTGATYVCEVTGKAGMVASNAATLTVMGLGTAVTTSDTTVTAIPDAPSGGVGTPVEVPFVVSGISGNVGEVTFSLYLTHTWVGDLDVTLVAPDNSTVTLARLINGGNIGKTDGSTSAFGTSCGTYTVFADAGTATIQTQTSANLPLVGTFKPSSALSAFNGKTANGTWKVRFQDLGNVDTGSYQCGVLSIKPFVNPGPSLNINGDTATDAYDLLEFLKLFGSTAPADLAKADFNGDGLINDADLTLLLNAL
jgi:subtilisin-like proprotein convertase family protein